MVSPEQGEFKKDTFFSRKYFFLIKWWLPMKAIFILVSPWCWNNQVEEIPISEGILHCDFHEQRFLTFCQLAVFHTSFDEFFGAKLWLSCTDKSTQINRLIFIATKYLPEFLKAASLRPFWQKLVLYDFLVEGNTTIDHKALHSVLEREISLLLVVHVEVVLPYPDQNTLKSTCIWAQRSPFGLVLVPRRSIQLPIKESFERIDH